MTGWEWNPRPQLAFSKADLPSTFLSKEQRAVERELCVQIPPAPLCFRLYIVFGNFFNKTEP